MTQRIVLVLFGLVLLLLRQSKADYFTAVAGMDELLVAEEILVNHLEVYMEQVEYRNAHIAEFLENIKENIAEKDGDSLYYYANPINIYKVLHKLRYDWKHKQQLVLNAIEIVEYQKSVDDLSTAYIKPDQEDLLGAIKGLSRLQQTYALEPMDIANGTLRGVKYSLDMRPSDCFIIGRVAHDLQEYHFAIPWLMEAQIRLQQEIQGVALPSGLPPMDDYLKILEYIAGAMSQIGNYKMAAKYNTEILLLAPDNQFALQHQEIVERNLQMQKQNFSGIVAPLPAIAVQQPKTEVQTLYEQLCREEPMRTPAEKRELRCRYVSNNVPFCILAPFKREELSHDPFVAYYHEAIYESEISTILNIAQTSVQRSKVGDALSSDFSDIRTSKNTWLWFHEHSFLNNIKTRLFDITGLNLERGEALQVANYGIGGHYGPHFDFAEREIEKTFPGSGNRILTALFYINHVEMGGATVFPFLRLSVPPIRRSLVVWYNMHESLELDYRTKHAGCPVLKGSKWICNEWFHEVGQEFTRPCSLHQLGHKSIVYKDKN